MTEFKLKSPIQRMAEGSKQIGIYEAPDFITNYIIKNRLTLKGITDFVSLAVRISFVHDVVYTFSNDLWGEVYKCVRETYKNKHNYIRNCTEVMTANPAGRPKGPSFVLAQTGVDELFTILFNTHKEEEQAGHNGPPPPYTNATR